MKICLAQIKPIKGDIEKNIEQHLRFINAAIGERADAIFFPELSLTGYEPELADTLAMGQYDSRLSIFQKLSREKEIVIGLGIPTPGKLKPRISLAIFRPNAQALLYSKQILHNDEIPYFEAGETQMILEIADTTIAPAICFESLQMEHATKASNLGANIYLASVAKPQHGIQKANDYYPELARLLKIPVLMVNCVGFCDNFESVGQSAIWNQEGKILAMLNTSEIGLLLFDTKKQKAQKINLA